MFNPLARTELHRITQIQVRYLNDRLVTRDMGLKLTEAALDKLAEAGFDPVYGARPLKRAIQQSLENPLAQEILAGKFAPGDLIVVTVEAGAFVFRKEALKAQVA